MERVSRKGEIEGIVKRKGIGKRRYVRFIEHYLKSRRNGCLLYTSDAADDTCVV